MSFIAKDLALAIVHHLLVFTLAGVLAFEIGVIRVNINAADIRRVARVDMWYGVLAAAILVVGFSRAIYAAKGWGYYAANPFFHAKLLAFLCVGLLSIRPTLAIIAWRKALARDDRFVPQQAEVQRVRRLLWTEAAIFALIPIFAAAMSRIQP